MRQRELCVYHERFATGSSSDGQPDFSQHGFEVQEASEAAGTTLEVGHPTVFAGLGSESNVFEATIIAWVRFTTPCYFAAVRPFG